MTRRARLAALLLAAAAVACLSPRPETVPVADQLFARRDFAAAAAAYEEELAAAPDAAGSDRIRFYLGLAYSVPDFGGDGTRRAVDHLQQLIVRHPDSRYRTSAEVLLALLRQRQTLLGQLQQLRQTATTLERQLEEMKKIDLDKGTPPPPDPG